MAVSKSSNDPPVLVTGSAGFIGYHVAERLLARGQRVVGLDNLNAYYDVRLKEARLANLLQAPGFTEARVDLADRTAMEAVFATHQPRLVIHLAAQAGVRYSLTDPHTYVASNLVGFLHVLEGCRSVGAEHLLYASTSSVYGANTSMPFREADAVDHPMTLYAASKRSNELMAHSYAHLFGFPCTGLRFFTVYGPWGRPDMALFKFTRAILEGTPIDVYNHGAMQRDFTYVDDVVNGILAVLDAPPPKPDATATQGVRSPVAPVQVYNIGRGAPVGLEAFISVLEDCLGKKAMRNTLPMQPGDVPATWADTGTLHDAVDYAPETSVREGVANFVAWYRGFYGV